MIGGDEKTLLFFYTGERPWNAANKLSQLVEVDERFESYFHDYQMNLIEITGNTSYNFSEEDVHNLFYICRSIYDQSIYEEKSNGFGLVKSSVLKVVKTLTDVEWLDLEELEEKEEIEMCEAEKRWLRKRRHVLLFNVCNNGYQEMKNLFFSFSSVI